LREGPTSFSKLKSNDVKRTFSGIPSPILKISLSFFPKLCLPLAIPTHYEGRTRRHEREAGCGGRGGAARRAAFFADGEAVWSRRPDAGAKRVEDVFTRDGDNKARSHRGERGISRKPSRRECRRKRLTCGDLLVCFFHSHTRLRVRLAPGIPCALIILRDYASCKTRARPVPRERGTMSWLFDM